MTKPAPVDFGDTALDQTALRTLLTRCWERGQSLGLSQAELAIEIGVLAENPQQRLSQLLFGKYKYKGARKRFPPIPQELGAKMAAWLKNRT